MEKEILQAAPYMLVCRVGTFLAASPPSFLLGSDHDGGVAGNRTVGGWKLPACESVRFACLRSFCCLQRLRLQAVSCFDIVCGKRCARYRCGSSATTGKWQGAK